MEKKPIQILGKRSVRPSAENWEELSTAAFIQLDLNDFLADTRVGPIYIRQSCLQEIADWARLSIHTKGTPEVGGLLLGIQRSKGETQYELKIDTFVPFREVLSQSVIELSVGSGAAFAYNEAAEQFPDCLVLGWFHTHPGHTPFLSATDLNQTHNQFAQDYQIAIVLDPLTPAHDTGIFSRKLDGSMNNAADFSTWISWKKLLENKKG